MRQTMLWTMLWTMAMSSSGCGVFMLAGTSNFIWESRMEERFDAWALQCELIEDTGAIHDVRLLAGSCNPTEKDRVERYMDCLEADGCDAGAACAAEAELAENRDACDVIGGL
jgi:hypothetical protein